MFSGTFSIMFKTCVVLLFVPSCSRLPFLEILCRSMVITWSRVWINRLRLPILLVVRWTGKMNISLSPFAPENLVSRDGLSSPVPRQPAHSPRSGWIWCLLPEFPPISAAASIYIFKPPYAIRSVPSLSGHANAYRWRSTPRARRHRASKPQGSSSSGCCLGMSPWTN